jgi:murein L,D-transpeptidase YafK
MARTTIATELSAATADARVTRLLKSHETLVVVTKHSRTLTLYRGHTLVGTYPVVFGVRPIGAKRYEGDLRTPEGEYRVSAKRPHERWRFFIEFDYPNADDRVSYEMAVAAGTVPRFAGALPGPGGQLGIHGNDRPSDQTAGRDWTKGCIAMRNEDVTSVYHSVEIGTPVVILP